MAKNKNDVEPTACECSHYDALDNEQLTEATLASGDYDVFTTGCTATTRNTFAPGHDAKLKSFFIKQEMAGHEIRRTGGGVAVSADAVSHANRFDFAHMVRSGIAKAQDKAAARQERVAKRAADKAAKPKKAERKLAEAAGVVSTTHDGNSARQEREAKAVSLAEVVKAEEAKHSEEVAASIPKPEWDDAPAVDGEGQLMRRTKAKVGRWEYKGEIRQIDNAAWFVYANRKGEVLKTREYNEA